MAPRYYGCIIPGPLPEAYSYARKPMTQHDLQQLTRPQQLEVTRADAETLVRKINAYAQQGRAVPLTTEHLQSGSQPLPTGSVTRAWIDPRTGGVFAAFEFDLESDGGSRQAHALLANKIFTGLSLRHDLRDTEPQELSLCLQGARAGTGVLGEFSDEAAASAVLDELNADAYKPAAHAPVSIAASNTAPTMNSSQPAQAAAAPAAPIPASTPVPVQSVTQPADPTAPAAAQPAANGSADPVMRLMEKIASPNAILSKQERLQVLNMFAQNMDAFEKVKKQHENKLTHFMEALKVLAQSALPREEADKFTSALQNQTGKALQENDMDTVINTVQPLIVAASERLSHGAQLAVAPSPPVLFSPDAMDTTASVAASSSSAPTAAAQTLAGAPSQQASLSSVILHTKVDPDMLPILNYLSQRRSNAPAPATMVQAPLQPMPIYATPASSYTIYSPPAPSPSRAHAYPAPPVVYASSNAPAAAHAEPTDASTPASWMKYLDPSLRNEFGSKNFNGMEFNAYKHYSRDLIEGLAAETESDRAKRQRIHDGR